MSVSKLLEAEMLRRLWALYDAAKVISEQGDRATVDAWAAFHRAVADVPERARTARAGERGDASKGFVTKQYTVTD